MTGKAIISICAGVGFGALILTRAGTKIADRVSKTSDKCRRRKESKK